MNNTINKEALASEQIIVAAPLSLVGSAQRIWRITKNSKHSFWMKTLAIMLIGMSWVGVLLWYALFGLLIVPYRLIRRSQRNSKKRELQHRELLESIKK